MGCVLKELEARLSNLKNKPELHCVAVETGWTNDKLQWKYVAWDVQSQKLRQADRAGIPYDKVVVLTQELRDLIVQLHVPQ